MAVRRQNMDTAVSITLRLPQLTAAVDKAVGPKHLPHPPLHIFCPVPHPALFPYDLLKLGAYSRFISSFAVVSLNYNTIAQDSLLPNHIPCT